MNQREPPPPYIASAQNIQQGSYPYPQKSSGQYYPQTPSVPAQLGSYPYPGPQQQVPYPHYETNANITISTVPVIPNEPQQVLFVGNCPACRTGILEDNYGLCAICCAILFFPLGIICCFLLKERRCSHCGAHFGA